MLKKLSLTLAIASFALVARPSQAQAPHVTITHSTGYDFFANWGTSQTCPDDPNATWNISTSLNYDDQFKIASLSLNFFNGCPSYGGTAVNASGETDASQYPFAWDFKQQVAIDKTLGRDGLIAWATYKASIPVFDFSLGCYLQADVNVRLDQQARAQHMTTLTRTSADGTITVTFNDFISRAAIGTGTIHLKAMPAGFVGSCTTAGLPPNFAIYPQVFSPFDGTPMTFIAETIDATITRTHPRAFPPAH